LIANVLQLPIARVDHPEPGLLGNACYALASTGTFPDVLAAATELRAPAKTFEPDPGLAGVYAEAASTYDLARRAFAESHLDQKLASSKG
jgi:sugar (pentulose or hexulose) kinase